MATIEMPIMKRSTLIRPIWSDIPADRTGPAAFPRAPLFDSAYRCKIYESVRCNEKYRLLNICKVRASAYATAVNDLALALGKTSDEEYAQLLDLAEKTRADSEAANVALFQHTREHGC
jgi:hypothetical protein